MQNRCPKVYIHTLGCPKNEADSRRMAEYLAEAGMLMVDSPEEASVVVVNTCAFIEDAVKESVEEVLEFAQTWKPADDDRRLVVAGCLASRYGSELASELPEADALVPVADEQRLPDLLAPLLARPDDARQPAARVGGPVGGSAPSAARRAYEYLTVSDGCSRRCAFCTIPAIRGPYRSRPPEEVVAEARVLLDAGVRELVLVGQDIASYGSDLTEGVTLADLALLLADLGGLLWLRLMYVQPDGVTDELIDTIASRGTICRYLDIPFQHASRDVLRRMGRSGDAQSHLGLLERLRDALPDIVIRTTLMTGFPGETDSDFETLLEFVQEARLDHVGVFAFSPEEGTPAASMAGRVPREVARERARELSLVAEEVSQEKSLELVGSRLQVLVEETDPAGSVGRWYGQAPEVDGVVLLEGAARPGGVVSATVVGVAGHDLIAGVDG
ncbi:MAG: 30S ribosomal protein S12 methylthiotransferase RimO [Coriobacteriia bacterium]